MKTKKEKWFLITLFILAYTGLQSQNAIVNQDTVSYYGTTDTLDYMPILINTNGNVVVSGNQKISATQYDATTAEQSINAVNTWITSFNPSNEKAFITCSVNDSGGNIYTAGAIRTPTSNGLDMMLIKRDPSGNLLWVYYYDGLGNMNDVASAICVDAADEVYITGVSDGGFPNLMDYVTIKVLPTSGVQAWVSRYNFNNAFDVPTSILYDAATNHIVVSGASGTSLTDFDFATVSYDITNGSQINEERIANTGGAGQDKVFGMVTDLNGNVYIAGTTYNGTNYNAQLVKLDTSLTTVYTKTLDFHGLDDAAIGVTLDDSSNVIIVGATYYNATNREMFIAKYDNSGTLIWKKNLKGDPNSLSDSEALRVIAKNHNEIFVGCNFATNGNQDLGILRFDKDGLQTMKCTYNGSSNGKEQLMDMTIDNNKIFVSARSFNGTDDDNIVITYSYRDVPQIVELSSSSPSKFIQNDVIVRFDKSALKMGKINDRKILFGKLSDFVNDSTCDKIEDALDPENELRLNAKGIPTRKLEVYLTEPDSLSDSRLGDKVKIPQVWASLIITLPSNFNTESSANTIHELKPDIKFAQTDQLFDFYWVPNDTYYAADQTSLHPSMTYGNAHINCEPAWDRTKGQTFVKVGIYDSGFYGGIPDFNSANITAYDYKGSTATDYQGHGTKVASVIAAKSNDGNGIAGISGGNNGSGGVSIVSMKINDYSSFATNATIKTALMSGATSTNVSGGKGLHIMNCSWGKLDSVASFELMEGIDFVNQNGVAFIAARGNAAGNYTHAINAPSQPATLSPHKVMNVGASGNNGEYHKIGVNGTLFSSMIDRDVDFLAPGAYANIMAVEAYESNPKLSQPATITYTNFGGTSGAAPHVTGVVGLMMSYRNQNFSTWTNIVHEDCEAILKRTATDLTNPTYTQSVGSDMVSGYGRINADSALHALEPQYKIRHIDLAHYATSSSTSTSTIASNVTRYWPGSSVFAPGLYNVDIVEYSVTYNYNFSNETFLDAWPLHKASNGHPQPTSTDIFNENYSSEITSVSLTSATLKTYAYLFMSQATAPFANYGGMASPTPSQLKAAFTLYTLGDPDEVDPTAIKQREADVNYFNVYPNPSNGNFTVGFSSKTETQGKLIIFDVSGRMVYENKQLQVKRGLNRLDVAINSLPKGIYFINLGIANNKALIKKISIN